MQRSRCFGIGPWRANSTTGSKGQAAVRWLDGAGRPVHPDFLEAQPRSYPVYMSRATSEDGSPVKSSKMFDITPPTHEVGYINHYSLRSLESFVMQSLRGDAVSAEVRRDVNYWRSYDRNQVHDDTIHKQSHRGEILQETLMNDNELARLHRQAVAYHRETFQKMARNTAIQTLMADCRAARVLTE